MVRSEIIAIIQSVSGVLSVDVATLRVGGELSGNVSVPFNSLPKIGVVSMVTTDIREW